MQIAIDRMPTIVNTMPLVFLLKKKPKPFNLYFHIVLKTEHGIVEKEKQMRLRKYIAGYVKAAGGGAPIVALAQHRLDILVGLQQSQSLADFVNALKLVSKIFARRKLEANDFVWGEEYEAFTVSHSQVDCVKKDIRRQTRLEKQASYTSSAAKHSGGKII